MKPAWWPAGAWGPALTALRRAGVARNEGYGADGYKGWIRVWLADSFTVRTGHPKRARPWLGGPDFAFALRPA
jgi:hypothetical protein